MTFELPSAGLNNTKVACTFFMIELKGTSGRKRRIYLCACFPCDVIVRPPKFNFFQIIFVSTGISLCSYSTHSVQSTKINLNELLKKIKAASAVMFWYAMI